MDRPIPKNRAQTKRRQRFGPPGSKPKEVDGGTRKLEKKALGYALLNVPTMTILAVRTSRAELRKQRGRVAAITNIIPVETVEVALWPLGVEGAKELADPSAMPVSVSNAKELVVVGLKDLLRAAPHATYCPYPSDGTPCNCYIRVTLDFVDKLETLP